MATKGFTKINNSIIFDLDLSLEALGLYNKLQYLSTMDNFSIKRDYVKSISGYGETAFRRVWKELKDKGLLLESKLSNKGRYEYAYTLSTATETVVPAAEKAKIDSDGNALIDGQVHLNEVLVDAENVAEVVESTGFNNSEATELLKVAHDDVDKVTMCYKYTLTQSNVKNTFNYTKWAITNNKTLKSTQNVVKGIFSNYPQRKYDFDKLERALLYGEPYKLPI